MRYSADTLKLHDLKQTYSLNTSYMTEPYIAFNLKMMVKSGREKLF